MDGLLECVPNFSEGRDEAALAAIRAAIEAHARVLDVHADADHNRSVFTCVGTEAGLVEGIAAGVAEAAARIDLRRHEGVHPRVGAADVVPFVRFAAGDEAPERAARAVGERIGASGIPILGYAELGGGLRPAHFRAGGTERLAARLAAGEVVPLYGPPELHETAGAVLLGVRTPLVAFNVDLATADAGIARDIAASVRERDGGLPGVQALGLRLAGRAQVSMNVVDLTATPLHQVVAEVERLASAHGVAVVGGELVGLVPAAVAAQAAGSALMLAEMTPEHVLEVAVSGRFGASAR